MKREGVNRLFIVEAKPEKNIVNNHSFCLSHQTDHYHGDETEGFEREGLEMER